MQAVCPDGEHTLDTHSDQCSACGMTRIRCTDCGVSLGYVRVWLDAWPRQCLGCTEARREQYLASGANYPLDAPETSDICRACRRSIPGHNRYDERPDGTAICHACFCR